MRFNRLVKLLPFIYIFLFTSVSFAQTHSDNFPVREYTNPEEIVTFDRTTSFSRALDVINEFSQEFRNKAIINRTNTDSNIGISIAPQHWMDALQLILRVKQLQLVERPEFFEIIVPQQQDQQGDQTQRTGGAAGGQQDGEGPVATTQTKEVRINAIFFEGNRRALREIGVDWSTISENTPESVTDAGEDGVQVPSSEFGDGPFVQVNSEGASNVSQRVFDAVLNFGEIGNSGISVQSLFSAFEAENLGEILSSPTIKVMDGEEGRIQVGQDFSVKQRDFAGNVVEDFFSVGTILEVTPQIIEQDDTTFVHLDISAERSSAQPDPVSTVINKQQAETQALLLDGQATVVAGLYRTEKSQVRRGIPILKDLPPWFFGLRYLFGYTSNDFLMRELVILLQITIEPTIPERMNEGVLTNKFEALQRERYRNQKDIEESDEIFDGNKLSDELDLDRTDVDDSPSEPEEEQKPVREEQDEEVQSADDSETQGQEDKTNDAKPVEDPEIEVPEVELNLGADSTRDSDQSDTEETTAEKATQEEDQVSENASKQPIVNEFYIIGGAFGKVANAKSHRDALRKAGFESVLLGKPNSEITMVAYGSYDDREAAKSALVTIQQNEDADAWLYRAK